MLIFLWNPLSHLAFTECPGRSRSVTAMEGRARPPGAVRSLQLQLPMVPFRRRQGLLSRHLRSSALPSASSSPCSVKKPLLLKGTETVTESPADSPIDFPVVDQDLAAHIAETLVNEVDEDSAKEAIYTNPNSIRIKGEENRGRRGNWIMRILQLRSLWNGKKKVVSDEPSSESQVTEEEVAPENDDTKKDDSSAATCVDCGCPTAKPGFSVLEYPRIEVKHDKESFSRFLHPVSSVSEITFFARLSHLANMAYKIRNIKAGDLLKTYGLRFITSSRRKEQEHSSSGKGSNVSEGNGHSRESRVNSKKGLSVDPSVAYQVAATAASYLYSQTRHLLTLRSTQAKKAGSVGQRSVDSGTCNGNDKDREAPKETLVCQVLPSDRFEECPEAHDLSDSEVASIFATSSMTAVVAAEEETKKAVADDLQSIHSSPCDWFICDDESSCTRYIIIQGSDSLASWQANLFFEPIQFEGFDVLVHRGIYEAAKGIYQQILPEIKSYMRKHEQCCHFRFTGHSLGGSLSVLVNLMLLIRGEVPLSSLLPVITFGSPCIMCGGDRLLEELGLPATHVQSIMMHRDIVPRAFSCHYPARVAEILKRLNANFRNHPCLESQGMLYAPMGQLIILQPDERMSPPHDLLPPGCGLYIVDAFVCSDRGSEPSMSVLVRAAQLEFLNSPHPLETLSDPGAYGVKGSICRDHESENYHRVIAHVLRRETRNLRRADRQKRKELWWTLITTEDYSSLSASTHRSSRVSAARAISQD